MNYFIVGLGLLFAIMIVLFGLRENDSSHSTVATQIER